MNNLHRTKTDFSPAIATDLEKRKLLLHLTKVLKVIDILTS